jgi:hypothetical protein
MAMMRFDFADLVKHTDNRFDLVIDGIQMLLAFFWGQLFIIALDDIR